MTTLKPCPLCGHAEPEQLTSGDDGECFYACGNDDCGVMGGYASTPDSAREIWNHRPGEEAVAEECAKIVEEPSGQYSVGHRRLPYWDGEAKAAEIRKRFGGKA